MHSGRRRWGDSFQPWRSPTRRRRLAARCARGEPGVDSGFRRGTDIVKALALGANAVLLGRAPLYGLAATGEAGVNHVLTLLKDEVDQTLAQVGCASASQLSPDYV